MHLRIAREPTEAGVTFGALYIDGRWFLWTLEDAIREVAGQLVASWKVPRQTAIPAGRYRVRLTWSNRFARVLPLLEGVEGFVGIRLHNGNTIEDTDGCPLVGTGRVALSKTQRPRVTGSRIALEKLMAVLETADPDDIWIAIENPHRDDTLAA